METPPTSKPLHAMSDAERRALLRRRDVAATEDAVEIGAPAAGGRIARVIAVVIVTLIVAAAFVVAFHQFTASWRVAVVVVGLMLAYMTVVGRMVEGRADRVE